MSLRVYCIYKLTYIHMYAIAYIQGSDFFFGKITAVNADGTYGEYIHANDMDLVRMYACMHVCMYACKHYGSEPLWHVW